MPKYEVKSAYAMSLRSVHGVNGTKQEDVPPNTLMLADSIWTAPADGPDCKAGDLWAHVVSIGTMTKNGWVAVRHLGVEYSTYRDASSTSGSNIESNPAATSGIVTVRKWGDPHLYQLDGMSTADIKIGNFQEVPLFHTFKDNPQKGEFGAITCFQELGRTELDYLKSIQPKDEFDLKKKMNWLIGLPNIRPPIQIYWSEEFTWDDPKIARIRFGTLVFGGQKVLVETDASGNRVEYTFTGTYRKKSQPELITFYKVIGMRKSEIGLPVTELLQEGKIQLCTSAVRGGGKEDVYSETPKGRVYHPVWSPLDYPSNYRTALYLAKEFCL